LRWKFRIRQRIWIHKVEVSIQFSAGSSTDSRNTWNKWKKVGASNIYIEKYVRKISVLCKIQCGWNVAKCTMRLLCPGVRFIRCYLLNPWSHRESPPYTRIISRTVGTSLLRFILRKSLVHDKRVRTMYISTLPQIKNLFKSDKNHIKIKYVIENIKI